MPLITLFALSTLSAPRPLPPSASGGYWQQAVRYVITARLDEPKGVLSGVERIWYHNNSPDTLSRFYMHLYLNAFRPGSKWSDRDSLEGRRRFNDLRDPDFGFNHVRNTRIDGVAVTATYPFAPDSTIVRFDLPGPLVPGDSLMLETDWDARPSTVPRRQGREGRRFDFAEWYPRVTAYDRYGWEDNPLQPAGEFYGDFGTFNVILDVPQDQVIGATGVPIEGDPGWERGKADPNLVVDYQRHYYDSTANPPPASPRCGPVAPGRKCVHFYAADVHHFAMSLNPEYRYEQGRYGNTVVRVLYQPRDSATWGHGIAVRRTEEALRWLHTIFGPFLWPDITNVHRIEGGGTEFPMMVMDGSDSQGLIIHEVGHNYVMGMLANNEWKEGWLDEGFTSFQTTWYWETHRPGYNTYYRDEAAILFLDLDGWSQPVSIPGHEFRDFDTYNEMTYTKGELFFHELRYIVGPKTMLAIMREYFRRYHLEHVDERALLETAEDVSHMNLKPFFAQWLHTTDLYDYAMGKVRRRRLADGTWETSVEVKRLADGVLPVEIGERPNGKTAPVVYGRVRGRQLRDTLVFRSKNEPGRLMLDPFVMTHDWNFTNNYERRPWSGNADEVWRFDDYLHDPVYRDRVAVSLGPAAWYNDAAGPTIGLRLRKNYLGRFDEATAFATVGVGGQDSLALRDAHRLGVSLHLANPTRLRAPNTSQSFDVWWMEGTAGVRLGVERRHPKSWHSGDVFSTAWRAQWTATYDSAFLDPTIWENGGSAELTHAWVWSLPDGKTDTRVALAGTGGLAYARRGVGTRLDQRYDVEPFGRATADASFRGPVAGFDVGFRVFAGGYAARSVPLKQRAIPLNGADPYQTLGDPFVRTAGALFVRPGVFYHAPGNADLRGYAPGLGGRWVGAANFEVERALGTARSGLIRRFGIVAFGDGGIADSLAVPGATGAAAVLADAGIGIRLRARAGGLDVPVRVEFPFFVSRPGLAQDTKASAVNRLAFRWLFSLERSF